MALGKLGLGTFGMALNVSDTYLGEAAELERLGFSAIWLPGGQIDNLGRLEDLTRSTTAVAVGSAIISLDVYPPEAVTGLYEQLEATAPGRLVAGLGGPQNPRPADSRIQVGVGGRLTRSAGGTRHRAAPSGGAAVWALAWTSGAGLLPVRERNYC